MAGGNVQSPTTTTLDPLDAYGFGGNASEAQDMSRTSMSLSPPPSELLQSTTEAFDDLLGDFPDTLAPKAEQEDTDIDDLSPIVAYNEEKMQVPREGTPSQYQDEGRYQGNTYGVQKRVNIQSYKGQEDEEDEMMEGLEVEEKENLVPVRRSATSKTTTTVTDVSSEPIRRSRLPRLAGCLGAPHTYNPLQSRAFSLSATHPHHTVLGTPLGFFCVEIGIIMFLLISKKKNVAYVYLDFYIAGVLLGCFLSISQLCHLSILFVWCLLGFEYHVTVFA